MLPKPKNSVTVGANKNRVFQRETNRSLVPHTLTKKPTTTTTIKSATNLKTKEEINTVNKIKDESDEDEEEEDEVSGNSFFSFGDDKPTSQSLPPTVPEKSQSTTITLNKSLDDKIQTINNISKNEKEITQKVLDNSLQTHKTQNNVAKNKASKGANKDNSFFANLFNNKTSQQKPKSSDRTDVDMDTAAVSLSSNQGVNEQLPTSYGVSAPYGRSDNSSLSAVTGPYSNTTNNVTAPYGSSNSNSVTRPYGNTSNSVTAPYGSGSNSNVTAPYSSYGNPSQHSHGYPSQPASESFFSYSHETTQHQPQHVNNVIVIYIFLTSRTSNNSLDNVFILDFFKFKINSIYFKNIHTINFLIV